MAKYYAAAQYIFLLPILWYAFQGTGIRVSDFFANVYRPAICAVVSGSITALVRDRWAVSLGLSGLTATMCLFSIAYVAIYSVVPGGHNELKYFRGKIGGSLRRDAAALTLSN